MRLVKIDSAHVVEHEENYNSNFHTEAEAPAEPIPSEIPQSFKRWLPLIARSQNIPLGCVQVIAVTTTEAQLILDASQSSLHTREPNRLYTEELAELAITFKSLKFPPGGLFLRLDACSPKDGVRGVSPLKTAEEIVLRLTTSHRSTNSILRCMENEKAVELFFLPFKARMQTEKEYRVFCAPPDGMITAVSQYRWHKTNFFASRSTAEITGIMGKVMIGVLEMHRSIMEEVGEGNGGEQDKLLLKQGFTFDVMFDEDSASCELIELNTFGARSRCGSCLFHWLRDWDQLYRVVRDGDTTESREVEMRISV